MGDHISVRIFHFRNYWTDLDEICYRGLHYKLLDEFIFYPYRPNIATTLHEDQIRH